MKKKLTTMILFLCIFAFPTSVLASTNVSQDPPEIKCKVIQKGKRTCKIKATWNKKTYATKYAVTIKKVNKDGKDVSNIATFATDKIGFTKSIDRKRKWVRVYVVAHNKNSQSKKGKSKVLKLN